MALTFMAKYDEREGNSCHIHLSFRGTDGALVMADKADDVPARVLRPVGRSFIAGSWRTCASSRCCSRRTSTPTSASPRGRSPRPRSSGVATTGPARCASSGRGPSLRLENRVPGGDTNPYLAVRGDGGGRSRRHREGSSGAPGEHRQRLPVRRAPGAVAPRRRLRPLGGLGVGRSTFGEESSSTTRTWAASRSRPSGRTITDWERFRGFERSNHPGPAEPPALVLGRRGSREFSCRSVPKSCLRGLL